MNRLQTFEQFIATQSAQIPVLGFILNLALAIILASILGRIYIRYGTAMTNRRPLANNFLMLTVTTLMIISIVKSSLALSLGLVGALSIVRFRAAIKEPEELMYLFFNIGIGLGLGADQRVITLITFGVICIILVIKKSKTVSDAGKNIYFTASYSTKDQVKLKEIVEILKRHCGMVDLKRFDETKDISEATFLLDMRQFDDLQAIRDELHTLNDSLQLTFLDNKGLM